VEKSLLTNWFNLSTYLTVIFGSKNCTIFSFFGVEVSTKSHSKIIIAFGDLNDYYKGNPQPQM